MRRKRLQHVADTMCQMFCGWRLDRSKPDLVKLGPGSLEIDAITGQCVFEGGSIERLNIAEEIHLWLQQDLENNKIPVTSIVRAHLAVKLLFTDVPWSDRGREIFFVEGKPVRTENLHRCTMECESNVTTDEVTYRSHLTGIQEWPPGWPG